MKKNKKINTMNTEKINFKGQFEIDGVLGGDTYPYWAVDELTYTKIKGKDSLEWANKTDSGKYKLYLSDLVSFSNEGKNQEITIRIVTK